MLQQFKSTTARPHTQPAAHDQHSSDITSPKEFGGNSINSNWINWISWAPTSPSLRKPQDVQLIINDYKSTELGISDALQTPVCFPSSSVSFSSWFHSLQLDIKCVLTCSCQIRFSLFLVAEPTTIHSDNPPRVSDILSSWKPKAE